MTLTVSSSKAVALPNCAPEPLMPEYTDHCQSPILTAVVGQPGPPAYPHDFDTECGKICASACVLNAAHTSNKEANTAVEVIRDLETQFIQSPRIILSDDRDR